MDKNYIDLADSLRMEDQSILQEITRAEIWKKVYALARKTAKDEIRKLDEKLAKKKLKAERLAAQEKKKAAANAAKRKKQRNKH